ncbi:unnamed protein product, partial [Amoebophrya sp. A25]
EKIPQEDVNYNTSPQKMSSSSTTRSRAGLSLCSGATNNERFVGGVGSPRVGEVIFDQHQRENDSRLPQGSGVFRPKKLFAHGEDGLPASVCEVASSKSSGDDDSCEDDDISSSHPSAHNFTVSRLSMGGDALDPRWLLSRKRGGRVGKVAQSDLASLPRGNKSIAGAFSSKTNLGLPEYPDFPTLLTAVANDDEMRDPGGHSQRFVVQNSSESAGGSHSSASSGPRKRSSWEDDACGARSSNDFDS